MSPLQQSVIGGVLITLLIFSVLALITLRSKRLGEEQQVSGDQPPVSNPPVTENTVAVDDVLSNYEVNRLIGELNSIMNLVLTFRHRYGSEIVGVSPDEVKGSDIQAYANSIQEITLGSSIPVLFNPAARFQWYWDPMTNTKGVRYLSKHKDDGDGVVEEWSIVFLIQNSTVYRSSAVNRDDLVEEMHARSKEQHVGFTRSSANQLIRDLTRLIT